MRFSRAFLSFFTFFCAVIRLSRAFPSFPDAFFPFPVRINEFMVRRIHFLVPMYLGIVQ